MSIIIPLQPVPNQTVSIPLNNQNCQINVYQKFFGLYLDLVNGGVGVRAGVSCLNGNLLIRYRYLPFIGDLMFLDTQGKTDPFYTGLGNRYLLAYLFPSELPS